MCSVRAASLDLLVEQGEAVGLPIDPEADEDIRSLQLTVLYGLKGVSDYTHRAFILGREEDKIYDFIHEVFSSTELTHEKV